MLPKTNRLKKKKDFDRVVQWGKTANGRFLVLKSAKNELENSRIGFVVSKKISNRAVVRNKVKRRLRAAVKGFLPNIRPSYDIALFTKKGIEEKDFPEIKEMAEEVFKKAKLLS